MFIISALISLYSLVVLVSAIGSWVSSDHEVFRAADRLVDPVLKPLRQLIPPMGGMDWTPLILLVALRLLGLLFR